MLKYIELEWSNCFSYGANNKISFIENPITQLVGKNGHGKSSIALILEEVQFNKNSKGIKKENILNRNVKDKSYTIALTFEKDGSLYKVETSRASTQKVALYKNGEDISSHTATATFKTLEGILGYDHKTFSQIVYQANTSNLEFLTATDTQRKKFLIDLLNLTKYTRASELFKEESSKLAKQLAVAETKVKGAEDWIAKYKDYDLTEKQLVEVPSEPTELEHKLASLHAKLATIDNENKLIIQNNKYGELLREVVIPPVPENYSEDALNDTRTSLGVVAAQKLTTTKEITALRSTKTKCPTCGQALGSAEHAEHLATSIAEKEAELVDLSVKEQLLKDAFTVLQKLQKENTAYQEAVALCEKYAGLWRSDMPSELISKTSVQKEISDIQTNIKLAKLAIQKANSENELVRMHNSKIALITQQLADMQEQLDTSKQEYLKVFTRTNNINVLVKAFSTTGLVAYKIECLVKDLESITNEYLAEMADGRFQLSFQVSSNDKLNVVITDNGKDIDINALSSGERARVNIATLLAIRKLMQTLSNTKTNLLILDEAIDNLDAEGKERLVEVLLEEDLNTFLISHSFTHPLIERMNIVKTRNISRIEA